MISEFEARFADVLASRLPAPFTGRAFVAPGPAGDNSSRLLLGVVGVRPVDPGLNSRRFEVVPGSANPHRVVRLECQVQIEARVGQNEGRAEQVRLLDAGLFALGADDLLTGAALNDNTDRGFVIEKMGLAEGAMPLSPPPPSPPPGGTVTGIAITAQGLFWPVGLPAEAGRVIGEIQFRGAVLPIAVTASARELRAAGPPVTYTVRIESPPAMRITASGAAAMPFGQLAFVVRQPGSRPGMGTLSGGTPGTDAAVRLFALSAAGEAAVVYTPPAAATIEDLIVALEHAGDVGVEIGRVPLRVLAP